MSWGRGARARGDSQRVGAGAGGSLLANLAAQPFVNKRPVQRFTMAAWAVTALLVGINVALWVNYRHQSTSLRNKIAAARADIDTKSRSVVKMDQELRGLRLGAQNAQVAFLNDRIAERTFPWSLLFERIADTLPDGVRLLSLNPAFSRDDKKLSRGAKESRAAAAGAAPGEELVNLKLQGTAKSDESLYQLIDAFFGSPAFASPRLYQESNTGVEVGFTVDVDYRPRYQPESSHRPAVAGENAADAGVGEDAEVGGEDAAVAGEDAEVAGKDTESAGEDAAGAETGMADADRDAAAAASSDHAGEEKQSASRSTATSRPHAAAPVKREDDLVKRLEAAHVEPRRPTPVATDADTGAEVDP